MFIWFFRKLGSFCIKRLICSALSTVVERRGFRDEGLWVMGRVRGIRDWRVKSKIKVENVTRKFIPGHRVVIDNQFPGRGHPDFAAFA